MRGAMVILAAALASTAGAAVAQQGAPMPTPGRVQPLPGTENNVSERMTGAERDARIDSDRAIEETRRSPNRKKKARAVAATPAELVVGAQVHDKQGALIGTIDAVDASGATLKTSVGLARVSADGFGKNDSGLLLDISKADFEAQVAAQNP